MKISFLMRKKNKGVIVLTVYFFLLLACNNNQDSNKASSISKTIVSFDQENLDLGELERDKKYPFSFEIQNKGENVLVISRVTTSCGCTVVDSIPEISPGETYKITGTFDTKGLIDSVERKVYLLTNTKEEFHVLRIRSVVI